MQRPFQADECMYHSMSRSPLRALACRHYGINNIATKRRVLKCSYIYIYNIYTQGRSEAIARRDRTLCNRHKFQPSNTITEHYHYTIESHPFITSNMIIKHGHRLASKRRAGRARARRRACRRRDPSVCRLLWMWCIRAAAFASLCATWATTSCPSTASS